MPLELASELWREVKRYVNLVDREEAAETVVSILVDNDIDPEDIKTSFKGDGDIKKALTEYLKDHEDDDYEEDEEYDDEDEEY